MAAEPEVDDPGVAAASIQIAVKDDVRVAAGR